MQSRAGIAFTHIRANHRHKNSETTHQYIHAIESERHQDMQKLKLKVTSKKPIKLFDFFKIIFNIRVTHVFQNPTKLIFYLF